MSQKRCKGSSRDQISLVQLMEVTVTWGGDRALYCTNNLSNKKIS